MSMHLNVFDNRVPYLERDNLWRYCVNSTFRLGWEDTDEPEKYDLNIHSHWSHSDLEKIKILPFFQKCIDETDWFTKNKLTKIVLNLTRSNDVHYIHIHQNQQAVLYYVNLDWRDGWHGETMFYNPNDQSEIAYASVYIPGRIILFDGSIPHAIRPQSVKAPKYRFTLSLFFD